MSENVVQMPAKTYNAKLQTLILSGLEVKIAGTLDGFIDLAVLPIHGISRTYSLTQGDALLLISALHAVVDDIAKNCLFDRDALLEPRK